MTVALTEPVNVPAPAAAEPVDALFALTLLRDEQAIDRRAATAAGALEVLRPLAALIVAGFAAHAVAMSLFMATSVPIPQAVHHGGSWFVAATVGFFLAVFAGLPSVWFYGIVARVPAPPWRLAVELLRVQAVGAVVLGALLPFWLAATLGLQLMGAELALSVVWVVASHALPFAAAIPGLFGLRRVFARMRAARGEAGGFSPFVLAGWWLVLFNYTAPATIFYLFQTLMGA
jgi:hypothetical protein